MDSWKSILNNEAIQVDQYLHSAGLYPLYPQGNLSFSGNQSKKKEINILDMRKKHTKVCLEIPFPGSKLN